VAQPGHWLGPVTGPGWLGPAQPMWAELDPAPKKLKNICMHKNNFFFIFLFTDIRVRNKNTELNL